MDSSIIHTLFEGAYGAFVNTDGFTVGAAAELMGAITIVSVGASASEWTLILFNLRAVGDCSYPPHQTFRLVKPGLCEPYQREPYLFPRLWVRVRADVSIDFGFGRAIILFTLQSITTMAKVDSPTSLQLSGMQLTTRKEQCGRISLTGHTWICECPPICSSIPSEVSGRC